MTTHSAASSGICAKRQACVIRCNIISMLIPRRMNVSVVLKRHAFRFGSLSTRGTLTFALSQLHQKKTINSSLRTFFSLPNTLNKLSCRFFFFPLLFFSPKPPLSHSPSLIWGLTTAESNNCFLVFLVQYAMGFILYK